MRVIIVIPASSKNKANNIALEFDPMGGGNTFSVPLYAVGGPYNNPTHYWCNWGGLTQQQYLDFQEALTGAGIDHDWFNGDEYTPAQVLSEVNLEPIQTI